MNKPIKNWPKKLNRLKFLRETKKEKRIYTKSKLVRLERAEENQTRIAAANKNARSKKQVLVRFNPRTFAVPDAFVTYWLSVSKTK